MNFLPQNLVAAAVAAIVGVSATAQGPAFSSHKVGQAQRAISTATAIVAEADGMFAAGRDWKATFAPTGVAFTPALGHRAPHNMPLRLSVASIRRGADTVLRPEATAPKRVDDAVVYDHGTIDERYDVRSEGIEQSFVFEQRLGGDGDLVVSCRVDTELQPTVRPDGTLSFLLEGVGGVHVGKVVGIDAEGDRVDGELRLDGDRLDLVLPDAFVDDAKFPLTLDPTIGVEFTVYDVNDVYESDIAYDLTTNRYLVVFDRRFSFTDIDVYGMRLSSTGAIVGGLILIDTTVSTVKRPRVANVNASDRWLVVWQRSGSPFGPWDIQCEVVNASDGLQSATVAVAATASDEFNPAVGGDATTSDNEAIVVYETETGISASQVTVAATGDPVVVTPVVISANAFANVPAISKASDATARHVIVWQQANLLSDSEIVAQLVDRNLNLLGTDLTVTTNSVNDSRPAVDGDGATYMVAWERTEAGGSSNRDIVCARLAATGSGLTIAVGPTVVEGTANEDEFDVDVAYLGSRFAVAYTQRTGALLDDCYAWLVNPDCTTCNANILLDGLNGLGWNRESGARIAATWIHDNSRDDAIITFAEAQDSPPFTSRIIGQRIENQSAGSGVVNAGGGCGLGGTSGTSGGPFVVGNSSFAFTVTGADPNAVLFLSLGFPGAGIFCGSCTLTNPLAFEFKLNAGGNCTSPYPVPCTSAFAGLALEFQWVSFNTAFSPCPNAPGLSASVRRQITMTL